MKSYLFRNTLLIAGVFMCMSLYSSAQKSLEGYWLGELNSTSDFTTSLKISKEAEKVSVVMDNPNEPRDQNLTVSDLVVDKNKVSFKLPQIRGVFEGVVSADNKVIDGKWTQYGYTIPLVFSKESSTGSSPIEGQWVCKRSKAKKPMVQLYKISKKESGEYESAFYRLDDVGQKIDNQKTVLNGDSLFMFDKNQAIVFVPSANGQTIEGLAKVGHHTVPFKAKKVNPDTLTVFHPRAFKDGKPVDYVYSKPVETGDGWKTATATDTAFLSKTKELMRAILKEELQKVSGIAVAKGGKLIMEEYFYQNTPNTLYDIGEMTGSVVSAITGIAIDEEYIENANEKVYSYFAEQYPLKSEEVGVKNQITIKHLLNMTSGLGANDFEPGSKDRLFKSKDWTGYALSVPVVKTPGEEFIYNSGNLIIMGSILEKATKQTVADFSQKHFFTPLGIKNYAWDYSPKGEAITSSFLHLSLRDAVKIGQLYLNQGKWNGKQIVSQKWITESTTDAERKNKSESKLKHMWWNTTAELEGKTLEMYFSHGFAGHKIFVIPSLDVVFVVIGKLRDGAEGKIINKFLLPAAAHL